MVGLPVTSIAVDSITIDQRRFIQNQIRCEKYSGNKRQKFQYYYCSLPPGISELISVFRGSSSHRRPDLQYLKNSVFIV